MRAPSRVARHGWLAAGAVVILGIQAQFVLLYLVLGGTAERLDSAREGLSEVEREIQGRTQDLSRLEGDVRLAQERLSDSHQAQELALASVDQDTRREIGRLQGDLGGLRRRVEKNAFWALAQQGAIGSLKNKMAPPPEDLERSLMEPSVQVLSSGEVGAGTLLHSESVAEGEGYVSLVLTAEHVLGRRSDDASEDADPPRVVIFRCGEEYLDVEARVLLADAARDLALLECRTAKGPLAAARPASRAALARIRVFDRVYAVGCPLGHPPLPTMGEILTLDKEVDGQRFWMMSAPTIFGNSGGGVFSADERELVGVASMICVYDQLIPIPVSHLGVLIPLPDVLDWLEAHGRGGDGSLLSPEATATSIPVAGGK